MYDFWKNDNPVIRREKPFEMRGRIIRNYINGFYFVPTRKSGQGTGVFQLKILREGAWAEGFCTYASDDEMVAVSHNIWVRENHPDYRLNLRMAEGILAKDFDFLTRPQP